MWSCQSINLGDGNTLDLALLPAGDFMMGASRNESGCESSEFPQHKVSVSEFWMGKYPVTQAQWKVVAGFPEVERVLDPDPSQFDGDNRPVEQVSWFDAIEFCQRLSNETGRDYRLPSEAEWEYACRAGTTTPFHFGEKISEQFFNYKKYLLEQPPGASFGTNEVGKFGANAFDLYDMHGNVWEWCLDQWHKDYCGAPIDASPWAIGGDDSFRVYRGGSWGSKPSLCRSAYRSRTNPVFRCNDIGFRVCCSIPRIS